MTTTEKVVLGIIIGVFALIVILAVWQTTQCASGHQTAPYYHAPTYVKSGNIMMPVGGGMQTDFVCDKWK